MTYSYRCNHCGHEFVRYNVPVERRHEAKCPKCGKDARLKLTGGLGFRVEGGESRWK